MYCWKNWQSMAEKEPPLGRVDNFQTGPNTNFSLSGNCLERRFPCFDMKIFLSKGYHKPYGRHAVKRHFHCWEEILWSVKKAG